MSFDLEKLSYAQIYALAEAHVKRFEGMLAATGREARYINHSECLNYLRIWRSVLSKVEPGNHRGSLTQEESAEIRTACFSGEYDDLLQIALGVN